MRTGGINTVIFPHFIGKNDELSRSITTKVNTSKDYTIN